MSSSHESPIGKSVKDAPLFLMKVGIKQDPDGCIKCNRSSARTLSNRRTINSSSNFSEISTNRSTNSSKRILSLYEDSNNGEKFCDHLVVNHQSKTSCFQLLAMVSKWSPMRLPPMPKCDPLSPLIAYLYQTGSISKVAAHSQMMCSINDVLPTCSYAI